MGIPPQCKLAQIQTGKRLQQANISRLDSKQTAHSLHGETIAMDNSDSATQHNVIHRLKSPEPHSHPQFFQNVRDAVWRYSCITSTKNPHVCEVFLCTRKVVIYSGNERRNTRCY